MVAVQARLDDVLLSTRNKRVDATEQSTFSVPGLATDSGKAQRITVDHSTEGKKELEKMIKTAEAKTAEAWAPLLALADVRTTTRAASVKKSKPQSSTRPDDDGASRETTPTVGPAANTSGGTSITPATTPA